MRPENRAEQDKPAMGNIQKNQGVAANPQKRNDCHQPDEKGPGPLSKSNPLAADGLSVHPSSRTKGSLEKL